MNEKKVEIFRGRKKTVSIKKTEPESGNVPRSSFRIPICFPYSLVIIPAYHYAEDFLGIVFPFPALIGNQNSPFTQQMFGPIF